MAVSFLLSGGVSIGVCTAGNIDNGRTLTFRSKIVMTNNNNCSPSHREIILIYNGRWLVWSNDNKNNPAENQQQPLCALLLENGSIRYGTCDTHYLTSDTPWPMEGFIAGPIVIGTASLLPDASISTRLQ